jgi:hypothetical protein
LHELAETARLEKISQCRNFGGGGDPDLFVFRPGHSECFFVEIKDRDSLNCNQRVCFRLIEQRLRCPVKVARLTSGDA